MFKSMVSKSWLAEVEAMEERLEGMKLTAWQFVARKDERFESIVRSTAGILKGRVPSGSLYQQRIRRQWNLSFRHRAT